MNTPTPTPKVLPDESLAESAVRLRLAVTRTARRLRQEAAAGDLTPTTAAALASIERHGPLTPSELADIENVKRPTVARTLGRLDELGLIERTADIADRRSSLVCINTEGRRRLKQLRRRKNAFLARRMRDLDSDELATLERASELLEQILGEKE